MNNLIKIEADKIRGLINYIENVTKGTVHQYSPHAQDILRYCKGKLKLHEIIKQVEDEIEAVEKQKTYAPIIDVFFKPPFKDL